MALLNHDPETVRKYLLGELTDDQQQNFEQRLLSEAELTQELEVITDDLVDEYLAKQLTPKESEWFEQHFLASPEGKRSQRFATTFHRYISKNPGKAKKRSWIEWLSAFWNQQSVPVKAVALAMVVVVVGIFWFARTPSPRNFATLTLTNSQITRSTGVELARIRVKEEDAIRINLMLEKPGPPGVRYRAELIDGSGQLRTLEPISQDARSVSLEIPTASLVPGQYAINLSKIAADNTAERIPGNYQFIIE